MARTLKAITNVMPPAGGTACNLATAISNISAKVEQVTKGGYNKHFSYNYARAPDVIKALAPLMHEHGIVITQSETDIQMMTPEVLRITYDFTVEHTLTGESKVIKQSGMAKVSGTKHGFNDKACQAVLTTTKKYFLIGLFNIVVDGVPDVDAIDEGGKPKTLTKQQAATTFKTLADEVATIKNLGDLQEWGDTHGVTIATLPADWQQTLRLRYTDKLHALRGEQAKPLTVVASPKSTLQPAKQGNSISQRAINSRAQRLRQAQQIGAVESEIEGPFDQNPY